MTPRPPARADMPALEWRDVSLPRFYYCSDDKSIECYVTVDYVNGDWVWEATIWPNGGGRKFGQGSCSGEKDGKAKVAEWLKANL